jgi:hypothetical protein
MRNFFGLLLVYILIIFGLFVLQFRSETPSPSPAAQGRFRPAETRRAGGGGAPQNLLEVSFPGIKIICNARNPAKLITQTAAVPLAIKAREDSPGKTSFTFTEGSKVTFFTEPSAGGQRFYISAEIPPDSRLILPYQTESGFAVTEHDPAQVLIASKDRRFALHSEYSSGAEIVISSENPLAVYSPYSPKRVFSFENALGLTRASAEAFQATAAALTDRLIAAYQESPDSSNEQTIVSYIAAMGERNHYATAFGRVPPAFRNSSSRTYLSAPFFDSLQEMNETLTARMRTLRRDMNAAAASKSLAFFTTPNLGDYLARESDSLAVAAFLGVPASLEEFAPSVLEAAGIVAAYSALTVTQRDYAALLEPVVESCLSLIEDSCALTGDTLAVYASPVSPDAPQGSRTDPLPLMGAVDVGAALVKYGTQKNQPPVMHTGYLLLNSVLDGASRLDLRTAGALYPRLAQGTYYPRSTVLASSQGKTVWAWHVSRSISYTRDAAGDVTIAIDFPQENTHYLILRGVEPFRNIYIYGVPYRTDPRFEFYNSSGYVYNAATQTLLVKSRHKTQRETIKLFYSSP